MFSLICAWVNGWVNNHEAGDLRRYRAHYDVTLMCVDVTDLRITRWLETWNSMTGINNIEASTNWPMIWLICTWHVETNLPLIKTVFALLFKLVLQLLLRIRFPWFSIDSCNCLPRIWCLRFYRCVHKSQGLNMLPYWVLIKIWQIASNYISNVSSCGKILTCISN